MRHKIILGVILFAFGLMGIASMLTMEMSLPSEVEVMLKDQFSSQQIRLLSLINPIIILLIATIVGTILYEKVDLKVPIIEKLLGKKITTINIPIILKSGVGGGIMAGSFGIVIGLFFHSYLPEEFVELGEKIKPSLVVRFLYGGITEEILVRFGFMTFLVWLLSLLSSSKKPTVYWIGILTAALVFALGHVPIAYQAVGYPSFMLLTYILIGNSIAGTIFGWLYWKRGLESAVIAHIFFHVVIVLTEPILN